MVKSLFFITITGACLLGSLVAGSGGYVPNTCVEKAGSSCPGGKTSFTFWRTGSPVGK